MALSIFEEWRLAHDADAFRDWLARGAPSDDALLSEGEERMHVALRMRVAFLSGMVLTAVGCGGGARGRAWPPAGPPPEVVKPLQVPESPYYLIYSPPVNLAKPSDTTAHGRKPGS